MDIGKAYVQIVPSAKGIQANTTKALNSQVVPAGTQAGAAMGGAIGGAAAKYLGAAALGAALVKSITNGAALEQSIGGIETLFKGSADSVIANADRAWKTAGISANQYMEQSTSFAASLLQSLGNDTNKAAKYADMAIIDMSDNANKMGTSIDMIQNAYQGFAKQNYTMLDNLKLGYGGTKTEMERLLKDAGKLSGQKYDIENLADVYEAIHVIQGELDITGTTSKEAATTLSGSFESMKSAATNFLGDLALGRDVDKSMSALAESASVFLFNNLVPALARVLTALPSAAITLIQKGVPAILKGISDFIPMMADKIVQMCNTFGTRISAWITQFANNPSMANGGMQIVKSIALGLLKALPQISVALVSMQSKIWKAVAKLGVSLLARGKTMGLNLVNGLWAGVKSKISGVINRIRGYFPIKLGRLFKGMKLPHFTLKLKSKDFGKLGSLKYPTGFGVNWYKTGGIFDSPSVIGVGEAGSEAVVPLDKLWAKMDAIASNNNASGGTMNVIITLDGKVLGDSTVNYINGQTLQFGVNPIMV